MEKINPDSERFWLIQLWLHIHYEIGHLIRWRVLCCRCYGVPMPPEYVTDILIQKFPNTTLWFSGDELLQVWEYECQHPEIHDNCEEYLKKQEIKRTFVAAK